MNEDYIAEIPDSLCTETVVLSMKYDSCSFYLLMLAGKSSQTSGHRINFSPYIMQPLPKQGVEPRVLGLPNFERVTFRAHLSIRHI